MLSTTTAMRQRSRRSALVLGIMVAGVLLATRAEAAPSCTVSTTAVNFGAYNVFNASPTDSTGTLTYNCSGNAQNLVITLSKGSSTTFNPRTMSNGTDTMSYNLYRNAARSIICGDGTGGSQSYQPANPTNGRDYVRTIYGRIPAGQDVSAGAYTDTITAIVNY